MEEKVVSAGNETAFIPGYAEDTDVLRHLLEVEAEAAALVDSAQAEADRRLKECEEQSRARFDGEYRRLVDSLETEYKNRLEAARTEYRAGLDEYRKSLDATPVDPAAFSRLAGELLFGGK
jgi:vacuolar-type H+-ATPase subunit H